MTWALLLANWQAVLASIIGIGTSLGIIGTWFTKKVIPFWVTHFQKVEELVAMAPKLEKVVEQFQPNGGSSMKDSLDRLEGYTIALAEQSEEQKEKLEAISETIVTIREKVAYLDGRVSK